MAEAGGSAASKTPSLLKNPQPKGEVSLRLAGGGVQRQHHLFRRLGVILGQRPGQGRSQPGEDVLDVLFKGGGSRAQRGRLGLAARQAQGREENQEHQAGGYSP